MKKRVVSMLLAVVMMLGMFPGTALAAGSVEEALGEVNIYNGEQKLSYLDDDGDSEICPCAFVMLMSDGKIEPFVFATDKDIERIANKGHTGFTGFVPTK